MSQLLVTGPGRPPPQAVSAGDVDVVRLGADNAAATTADKVVVEEPLEIRLGARSLLVTMRTPGRDPDLVRGLVFTEGLVPEPGDVTAVTFCRDVPPEAKGNVVSISLRTGAELDEARTVRTGLVSSGCGICGKATLEAIAHISPRVADGPALTPDLLRRLPAELRGGQDLFGHTGGLHAAALFSADGSRLALAEDVGRHNAVDKVVGEAIRFGRLPLTDTILVVSGRTGFEIVHKARMAGIPVVASISAPSSIAINLARDGGQTLVGFLRDGRFNVYTGARRFDPPLLSAESRLPT